MENKPNATTREAGICDTTMTKRLATENCECPTYPENLGPCETYLEGSNGRCVYCDHTAKCHRLAAPSATKPDVEKIAREAAEWIAQNCALHLPYIRPRETGKAAQHIHLALAQVRAPLVETLNESMFYLDHAPVCKTRGLLHHQSCDCGLVELKSKIAALTGTEKKT